MPTATLHLERLTWSKVLSALLGAALLLPGCSGGSATANDDGGAGDTANPEKCEIPPYGTDIGLRTADAGALPGRATAATTVGDHVLVCGDGYVAAVTPDQTQDVVAVVLVLVVGAVVVGIVGACASRRCGYVGGLAVMEVQRGRDEWIDVVRRCDVSGVEDRRRAPAVSRGDVYDARRRPVAEESTATTCTAYVPMASGTRSGAVSVGPATMKSASEPGGSTTTLHSYCRVSPG